jgi:hypothetical protein
MEVVLDRCFADPAVSAVLVDPLAGNVRAHPILAFVIKRCPCKRGH